VRLAEKVVRVPVVSAVKVMKKEAETIYVDLVAFYYKRLEMFQALVV
jgi:hypothetical protein